MNKTLVSLFKGVDAKPIPVVLLDVLTTKQEEWKDTIIKLREEPDEKKQKQMKKQLPSFSVSGLFSNGHNEKDLETPSNFLCVDIDEHDNTHISNFRDIKQLCKSIPYVSYCGLSCRGKGFFMIIPYKDHTKHKQYFDFCQKLFRCFGITIDPKCYDICRLRFVSYDPDPYINLDAETFDFVLPPLPSLATPKQRFLDLKTFLDSHNISYETKEIDDADGDGYLVDCPWAENHTSDNPDEPDKALVFLHKDGQLCFNCFHSHCAKKQWSDYRNFYEQ